jgi:hypothetical protein
MPLKSCPTCGTGNGPNAHACKGCGHTFTKKVSVAHQMIAERPPAIVRTIEAKPAFVAPIPKFDPIGYSDINFDPANFFSGLVERESQINITCSAIRTAVMTDFEITNSLLFHGPSSAGKTSFMTAICHMVGQRHCFRVDAKTATKAGMINELMARGSTTKFLCVDEIEKNLPAFSWLLPVLEEHTLRVINANQDNPVVMRLPVLGIFTCNDVERLRAFESGALYSRMINKIYCPPISDESLFAVLQPYADRVDISDKAIKNVIDYVRSAGGGNDIREMKGVLMDGGKRWENGEYADILRSTNINTYI